MRLLPSAPAVIAVLLVMASGAVGCGVLKEGFNLFVDDTKLEIDTKAKESNPPPVVDFEKVY